MTAFRRSLVHGRVPRLGFTLAQPSRTGVDSDAGLGGVPITGMAIGGASADTSPKAAARVTMLLGEANWAYSTRAC